MDATTRTVPHEDPAGLSADRSPGRGDAQPTVPLRPLAVTEVLDGAVRLVRRNARAAYAIAVPFAIVHTAVSLLVSLGSSPTAVLGIGSPVSIVVTGVLATVFGGLFAPVVEGDVLGRRLSLREALHRAGGRSWLLVVLGVIVTVSEDVGVVLLVVGGVFLWGVWAVAAPAFVLERQGLVGCLRRSFRLTRRQFWRTWGTRALASAAVAVLNAIFTVPATLLADLVARPGVGGRSSSYLVIVAAGGLIAAALTAPLLAAVDGLLYVDLRMRGEGLDLRIALDRRSVPIGTGRAWPA